MTISNLTLQELLPNSLTSHPCVSINKTEKVWSGSILLIHYLESFTDSLVVVDNFTPIGIIGGQDILKQISKNPTSELFFNREIQDIMYPTVNQVFPETTISDLISNWHSSHRAFSIISNSLGNYSGISARSVMEIGIKSNTELRVSDLPKKKVVTCQNDDKIEHIINMMFENKTRKIILQNSKKFISDRVILEKISRDLDHLKNCNDFLNLQVCDFALADAKIIEDDYLLPKIYEMMFSSIHPYLIYEDQVISPWDLCLILSSLSLHTK